MNSLHICAGNGKSQNYKKRKKNKKICKKKTFLEMVGKTNPKFNDHFMHPNESHFFVKKWFHAICCPHLSTQISNFKRIFLFPYWLSGLFLEIQKIRTHFRGSNFFSIAFQTKWKIVIFFKISPPKCTPSKKQKNSCRKLGDKTKWNLSKKIKKCISKIHS